MKLPKTKVCTNCRKRKPLADYYKDPRHSTGRQSQCKRCMCDYIKHHYNTHPAEHMVRRAVARARAKGLPCTITVADITPLPEHCPVLGLKLTNNNGQQNPSAYSLDRIDNAKGYVPGNVVVMSYLANRLKNDGTAEQHEKIARWMRTHGVR